MSARQRKKDHKPEKPKGPKKKPKESDHLWKIVLAFVVIIGIATAAIYFIGEKTNVDETAKPDDIKVAKEKPVKNKKGQKAKEKTKAKPAKKDQNAAITNAFDKTILKDLDEAEKLLKTKQVEKAKRAFEKLVRDHPDSPRAMYGLARSLDELADVRRSNEILQEAIDSLGKVGKIKDCPVALKRLAVMRQAERASFLGKTNVAVQVLEDLAKSLPPDLEVYNKLGVQFLLHGNQHRAKKAFKESLQINPNDGFALVHMGFIVKSESKYVESIPLLQRGIATREPGTDDSRFFFHLGDAFYRTGKHKEAYEVFGEGAKRGHFLSTMQRSLYNAQTPLRAKPFWEPEETPYHKQMRILEKNWKTIRDEGVALYDPKKGAFMPEEEGLREKGDWQQFTMFFQGRKDQSACAKAPKTCSLIEQIPEAAKCKRGQVKYSVMKPDTHVWAHCGPTNCRIRGHLGLVIPDGVYIRVNQTTSSWKEGKFIIIDDSIEHEVWHNGTSLRMILIVDFWHPDLPKSERDRLSPI
ncbi:aspartyl/asparaginyl beta-hydroxylase-like [Dendronephthya gigantea]|uniref:aspartyl/asparaginyl beta-hydroxylase-like n=1 Tax=Dendronephthya gigantea TaxID=151771 RepID=UPI00106BD905|nr:aspartyl/asparaginyl beta-hydroxylase-like [Dendronephthya gigantea]